MLSKTLSAAAVALAASSLVSAQTFTECNPTKQSCPADPAFGSSVTCDFSKGPCDAFKGTEVQHGPQGAVFSIAKDKESPTIHTGKYIFFGRVDVVMQAAPGRGIVTSAVLQSDDLDEIDWEFVGGDNARAQTNYFSKGDTTVYDRGAYHPVANPVGQFHKYSIEWTRKAVVWSIDDAPVRTLRYEDAKGGSAFPQTPMQIKLGTWVAGGAGSAKGTAEWAGGYTDFSKAPFVAYYKSISIADYAGKDAPAQGGVKEYVYDGRSGSWQSIKVVGGHSDATTNAGENGRADAGAGNGSSSHNEAKAPLEHNSSRSAASGTAAPSTPSDGPDSPAATDAGDAPGPTDGPDSADGPETTAAVPTTMSSRYGANGTVTSGSYGGPTGSGAGPASTAIPTSASGRNAVVYAPAVLAAVFAAGLLL